MVLFYSSKSVLFKNIHTLTNHPIRFKRIQIPFIAKKSNTGKLLLLHRDSTKKEFLLFYDSHIDRLILKIIQ